MASGGTKTVRKTFPAENGGEISDTGPTASREILDPETAQLLNAAMATKKPRVDRTITTSSVPTTTTVLDKKSANDIKSTGSAVNDVEVAHASVKTTKTREAKKQISAEGVNGDSNERKSRRTTIAAPEEFGIFFFLFYSIRCQYECPFQNRNVERSSLPTRLVSEVSGGQLHWRTARLSATQSSAL